MLFRLLAGAGLFALGYYIGKQVGLTEPLRDEMARAREADAAEDKHADPGNDDPT